LAFNIVKNGNYISRDNEHKPLLKYELTLIFHVIKTLLCASSQKNDMLKYMLVSFFTFSKCIELVIVPNKYCIHKDLCKDSNKSNVL